MLLLPFVALRVLDLPQREQLFLLAERSRELSRPVCLVEAMPNPFVVGSRGADHRDMFVLLPVLWGQILARRFQSKIAQI